MDEDVALLKISTLGNFSVSVGDTVVSNQAVRSKQIWRLLKYLIANRNYPVTVTTLMDALWEDGETENPLASLYSLAHRLRQLLTPKGAEPCFRYTNGAYQWNPKAKVQLDVDLFERYCEKAHNPAAQEKTKIDNYRQAVELYHGDFFAESSNELWVMPIQAHYREMFTAAVRELTRFYIENMAFGDALEMATKAVATDPYSEEGQILFLRAQIGLGHYEQARKHYEQVTDMLYDEYGVKPSETLNAVMMEIPRNDRGTISTIYEYMEHLEPDREAKGAFLCDADLFRGFYQWQERLIARSGMSVFLALVTVAPMKTLDSDRQRKSFYEDVQTFISFFTASLRRADVICQCAATQISLLMTCLTYEDCKMVVDRITSAFFTTYNKIRFRVSCKISAVET